MMKSLAVAGLALICSASASVAGDLPVRVQTDGKSLVFSSLSGAALSDCNVFLNDGYKAHVDAVPASGSTSLNLGEFVSKGVLRFEPRVEPVRRVHVICRSPSGDALFKLQ